MNKRRIRGWVCAFLSIVLMLFVIMLSIHGLRKNVSAVDDDVKNAHRNAAIKILAKNLKDCYNNAKGTIDFSDSDGNYSDSNYWNFSSSAYWSEPNKAVFYPKVLAGKVGDVESTDCAKMIVGWNTNSFIDFFTNDGEFVGVKQKVVVPSDIDMSSYSNLSLVQQYLYGVGYTEETSPDEELNDYYCIYFKLKVSPYFFSLYEYPKPYDYNNDLFMSREIYCVPLEEKIRLDNGKLDTAKSYIDFEKVVHVYGERTDSGKFFLREEDDEDLPMFALFKFGQSEFIVKDEQFYVTIPVIYGAYNVENSTTDGVSGLDSTAGSIDVDSEGCQYWKNDEFFGIVVGSHCSLLDQTEKDMTMSFNTFKTRFTRYINYLKNPDFTSLMTSGYPNLFVGCDEEEKSKTDECNKDRIFYEVEAIELDPSNDTAKFKKGEDSGRFVRYFLDIGDNDYDYRLDKAEQYIFYYNHLAKFFGDKLKMSDYLFDSEPKETSYSVLWLDENAKIFSKKYLAMPSSVNSKKACVLTDEGIWPDSNCVNMQRDWEGFAQKLSEFKEEELKDAFSNVGKLDPDYSEDVDKQEKEDEGIKVCYDNSGPLGWIMCPVISGISAIGQHMWTQIEEYHMKIPASEVFKTNGGVEKGWKTVQNIANIVFIFVFLFIIFSQLTGYGIDNYGIKKLLPRLIVIAILMNLSYVICEIAVDLSNILGIGLNNMFSDWASSTGGAAAGIPGVGAASLGIAEVAIASGGLFLFQLLTNGTWSGALAGIGLLVLGVIIIIVAAMLTLYLILVAREAGVVLAIIIAPLAFVCYALPNTDKLGKKWFDLFRALILVYPICGATIGLGQLAGGILSSIDNAGMQIAAMIVQVLPFFFIPMLLKNSLTIMGNVGAKISSYGRSIGQRASKGAQGMIQNTERYKNWSQGQKEAAEERRARRVSGRLKSLPSLNDWQKEKLRKAEDILLSRQKRRKENDMRTKYDYYGAMINKQDLSTEAEVESISKLIDPKIKMAELQSLKDKARLERSKARTTLLMEDTKSKGLNELIGDWKIAFTANNKDDLDALTNVLIQRYGPSAANGMATALDEFEHIGTNPNFRGSMETLQQTMNDNGNFSGLMKSKAPDAFQMISDAGRRWDANTNSMVYEDLEWFSKNNKTATAAKDWATASGDTLLRAINNKVLSERMLRELLTSDDPAVKSGLQSEDGKREKLEAALFMRQLDGSGETSLKATLDSIPRSNTVTRNGVEKYEWVAEASEIFEKRAKQEAEAKEAGKSKLTYTDIPGGGSTITFDGFAHPFNVPNLKPTVDKSNGHYIYINTDGAKWDATVGRYIYD